MHELNRPLSAIVVMGVSGSGKSTVGHALAERLGWPFAEGDALHPAANIAKMSAGVPLTDEDRAPWLDAVADRIELWRRAGGSGVITCSALKRAYRLRLAGGHGDVLFAYLRGDGALLAQRMGQREDHFMPLSLLQSQLETLEAPEGDEPAVTVDIAEPLEAQIDAIETGIAARDEAFSET